MMKNNLHLIALLGFLTSLSSVSAQELDHRQGEFIICLHQADQLSAFVERHRFFNNVTTDLRAKKCLSRSGNIWQVSYDFAEVNGHEFKQSLEQDPGVRIVQHNHFLKKRSRQPDDPLVDEQWQWFNISARSEVAMSSLQRAWDITTGGLSAHGDTIVVAAIDVGVNDKHEDLRQNIWINHAEIPGNEIDDDENGYVDDYRGWNVVEENDNIDPEEFGGSQDAHGTEILGTIGAAGNNGFGVSGVNWNVKMMNVYFNSDLNEADMIGAYGYIMEQRKMYNESNGTKGAFVVSTNLSYGDEDLTPEETPIWCAVYDMLGEVGILNCAATANEALDIDSIKDVPTSCLSDFMISVTATDINDNRTFSAFGKNDIDLAAPGELVYTTNLNAYGTVTGTSYASPIVAGAIALLYASPCADLANLAKTDPAAAARMARELILSQVDPIESLTDQVSSGGRLNIFNTISSSLSACMECVAPFDVVAEVSPAVVNISWSLEDSTATTNLEYRMIGDTNWVLVENVTSPTSLADLGDCQTFEFQLTSMCLDSTSATSNIGGFTTSLCCDSPGGLRLGEVTDGSANIQWDSVTAALSYELRATTVDSISWDTIALSSTSAQLDSLLPCQEYLVQIRTICTGMSSMFGDTLHLRTLGCGPCLDSTYCELDVQPFGAEWIESFTLNTIDNTSGYNDGYGDFTGDATTLLTDNSYDLTFRPGFAGDTLAENYFAWIDYNQNGAFENETELVFASDSATADSVVIGTFTVPFDAPEGLTRLRVLMLFEPLDTVMGCGQLVDLGEAEDYCVNIVFDSLLCPKPEGVDTANFAGTSTDIVWERVDSAIAYTIRYRKMGEEEWEEAADTANMYALSELEECADYEVQVQAVCMQDTSGYTESFVFSTFCSTNVPELALVESFDVFPNPFLSEFSIQLESKSAFHAQMELWQPDGSLILNQPVPVTEGKNSLVVKDLNDLSSGVYFLTLRSDSGQIVRKLMKP